MLSQKTHDIYVELLKRELIPALGCTEPIAIAYAAAKARSVLGEFPDKIYVECSGNIIKNVKGVIVPTTGDMKGVDTSAILGTVGGNADYELEVLSDITEEHLAKTKELLNTDFCDVELKKNVSNLYIRVLAEKGESCAEVEIIDKHTNITSIKKDGKVIFKKECILKDDKPCCNDINVDSIYEFATTVDLDMVRAPLERQIEYNQKIADEGIKNDYGANVGKTLLKHRAYDIRTEARAYAAAGSDARMAGSTMPVVINSGSGNQGMVVSLPIIKYAKHLNVSHEKLLRALVLSNLMAMYLKMGIGNLSAYCGAVSAACGTGAGISYLYDLPLSDIKQTIKNTLGNVSGIVCDGAKASCAAKVASSVDAAILAHDMASDGEGFGNCEGLNLPDVDETIGNIARLARDGMKETDIEILNMMIEKRKC